MLRQRLGSAIGDEIVPLDPDAADPFDIEAGFEGDDVAGHENLVGLGDEVGGFGVPEADPVAGVVGEVVEQAERSEMVADGGVGLDGGTSRLEFRLGRLQGSDAGVEELRCSGVGPPPTAKVLVKSLR